MQESRAERAAQALGRGAACAAEQPDAEEAGSHLTARRGLLSHSM